MPFFVDDQLCDDDGGDGDSLHIYIYILQEI